MAELPSLQQNNQRLPIAYAPGFRASAQKGDPFLDELRIPIGALFGATPISDSILQRVFDLNYLEATKQKGSNAQFLGVGDMGSDFISWSRNVVGASITAAQVASQHGLGISRFGGFHHASFDSGQDLCVFSDVLLIAHLILEMHPSNTIYVIDTDAHVANGLSKAIDRFKGRVRVFDLHSNQFERFVPKDHSTHYVPISVEPTSNDARYLSYINNMLATVSEEIRKTPADYVIFLSGNDILEGDPKGGMQVSAQGLLARDQVIFEFSLGLFSEQRGKTPPFLWLPGGGYTEASDKVFAKSVRNIMGLFRERRVSKEPV